MGFESTVDTAALTLLTRLGAPWASLPNMLYVGDDYRIHHNPRCMRGTSRKLMVAVHDKRAKLKRGPLGPCADCVTPFHRLVPQGVDEDMNILVEDAKQVHLLNVALGAVDTLSARVAASRCLFTLQQATGRPRRQVLAGDLGFEMSVWARAQHLRTLTAVEEQRSRLRRWVDGPFVKPRNRLFVFKDVNQALACKGQDAQAAGAAAMAWPQLAADVRTRWVLTMGPARRDDPSWLTTAEGAGFVVPLGMSVPGDDDDLWRTFAALCEQGLSFRDALATARAIAA